MSVRKKYAKEFKLDAVSLVLDQGYTQAKGGKKPGPQFQHAGPLDQGVSIR